MPRITMLQVSLCTAAIEICFVAARDSKGRFLFLLPLALTMIVSAYQHLQRPSSSDAEASE